MKRSIFTLAAAAILIAALPLAAQTANADDEFEMVFAPFISSLSADAKDDVVKLVWTDARDVKGSVIIFRSQKPFEGSKGDFSTKLAEVPYGAGSYIDHPPSPGVWYYFVAATDEANIRYDIMIPYVNTISAQVKEPDAAVLAAASVAPGGTVATVSAFSDIHAAVQGDSVVVSYAGGAGSGAILYRSATPIARIQDLLGAVIVLAGAQASPFVDYPVPGIGYYYAILAEDELKSGKVSIVQGRNATASSVEVPAGRYRVGLPGPQRDTRSMPLPLISVEAAYPAAATGAPPPAVPATLSPAATKAVAGLAPAKIEQKPVVQRKPRAFPQDLEAPAGGEEYALRSIVQGPFAKRDWEESTAQLASYLSLPRSPASEARARYYLGQAYYFGGKPREALFEFLLVQKQYAAEAGEWIHSLLPQLSTQ
jgi:hypothetical protein